jgi:hypothetical protein
VANGELKFAILDYDVHSGASVYPVIYKHLGGVSLPYTESVDLVNLAHAFKVEKAMNDINEDLRKKGKPQMTFNLTEISERSFDKVRERSKEALLNLVKAIGTSLMASIESLEKKFNDKTDDVEEHLMKKRLRLASAARDVKAAKGLALIFLLEKDVKSVIEAQEKLVTAQKEAYGESKAKHKAEVKAEKAKDAPPPKVKAPKKKAAPKGAKKASAPVTPDPAVSATKA